VYEALEHAKGAQRSFDLVTVTGLSRTAVYEALDTLAAWHLVEPVDGRWRLVPGTSLELLAEQFGCLEQVRIQVGRHRGERAAYRRALRIVDQHPEARPSARSTRPRRTCGHRNRHPRTGKPSWTCCTANSAPT
jgi:DNA-binding GntR family transcriptional regulator